MAAKKKTAGKKGAGKMAKNAARKSAAVVKKAVAKKPAAKKAAKRNVAATVVKPTAMAAPVPRPPAATARPPTEQAQVAVAYNFTPNRIQDWRGIPGSTLEQRDLGLDAATRGLMTARHVRAQGALAKLAWRRPALDFHYVYCVKGWMRFADDKGGSVTLRPGDGANLPPSFPRGEIEVSSDFEMMELTAPLGRAAPSKKRTDRFAVDYDRPEAYISGDGPRAFMAYRDAGATAATGRRVNINIVRLNSASDESTGWHYHTLSCQFVFVLRGWSKVIVEGNSEVTLRAGDAMTIPFGVKHDVPGFSGDFAVLELNMPADYTTIATEAPAAA